MSTYRNRIKRPAFASFALTAFALFAAACASGDEGEDATREGGSVAESAAPIAVGDDPPAADRAAPAAEPAAAGASCTPPPAGVCMKAAQNCKYGWEEWCDIWARCLGECY